MYAARPVLMACDTMDVSPPKILILAGPTASGKTAASIAIAEEFGAVVLSADAMQVYRGMDVGTAKATDEERARVPHFGIDVVDPTGHFDASSFAHLGESLLSEGRRVVVAGGTSLYIRSLVRGLVKTPPVDEALRQELMELSNKHAALQEVDPELADRLHPNDIVRIVRGLEVFRATGTKLSAMQAAHAKQPDRVPARALWLDRENLRERIGQRLHSMMDRGYLEETEALLAAGVPVDARPMRAFAYQHIVAHAQGSISLETAISRTEIGTWQFARKQRNWMRALQYEHVGADHTACALRAAKEVFG